MMRFLTSRDVVVGLALECACPIEESEEVTYRDPDFAILSEIYQIAFQVVLRQTSSLSLKEIVNSLLTIGEGSRFHSSFTKAVENFTEVHSVFELVEEVSGRLKGELYEDRLGEVHRRSPIGIIFRFLVNCFRTTDFLLLAEIPGEIQEVWHHRNRVSEGATVQTPVSLEDSESKIEKIHLEYDNKFFLGTHMQRFVVPPEHSAGIANTPGGGGGGGGNRVVSSQQKRAIMTPYALIELARACERQGQSRSSMESLGESLNAGLTFDRRAFGVALAEVARTWLRAPHVLKFLVGKCLGSGLEAVSAYAAVLVACQQMQTRGFAGASTSAALRATATSLPPPSYVNRAVAVFACLGSVASSEASVHVQEAAAGRGGGGFGMDVFDQPEAAEVETSGAKSVTVTHHHRSGVPSRKFVYLPTTGKLEPGTCADPVFQSIQANIGRIDHALYLVSVANKSGSVPPSTTQKRRLENAEGAKPKQSTQQHSPATATLRQSRATIASLAKISAHLTSLFYRDAGKGALADIYARLADRCDDSTSTALIDKEMMLVSAASATFTKLFIARPLEHTTAHLQAWAADCAGFLKRLKLEAAGPAEPVTASYLLRLNIPLLETMSFIDMNLSLVRLHLAKREYSRCGPYLAVLSRFGSLFLFRHYFLFHLSSAHLEFSRGNADGVFRNLRECLRLVQTENGPSGTAAAAASDSLYVSATGLVSSTKIQAVATTPLRHQREIGRGYDRSKAVYYYSALLHFCDALLNGGTVLFRISGRRTTDNELRTSCKRLLQELQKRFTSARSPLLTVLCESVASNTPVASRGESGAASGNEPVGALVLAFNPALLP